VLDARGAANGSFDVNLPILFQQFPNHLSLKNGLRVTQGAVKIGVNANLNDDAQNATVSLGLNQPLVAEQPGKSPVAIQPPMIVTGMVYRAGSGDPTVIADVNSSFLAGRANLSRADLAANFDIDLTRANTELGEIFDFFDEWDLSGKGRVNARVANYDQPENHITFNANMNNLLVKKGGTAFLQEPAFIGGGEATVNRETKRLTKGKINADSQILKGTGSFDVIQLAEEGPPSEVSGLNFGGALNLERGVNLLKGLGVVTNDVSASGFANVNLNVGMEGDAIATGSATWRSSTTPRSR